MSRAKVGDGVFSGPGAPAPKRDGEGIALGVDPLRLAYPPSFFSIGKPMRVMSPAKSLITRGWKIQGHSL